MLDYARAHALACLDKVKPPLAMLKITWFLVLVGSAALSPTRTVSRRGALLQVLGASAASSALTAPAVVAAADGNAFVGTYSDPNHPGGTRTVRLLEAKVGEYQLAEVAGGGGLGEPKSYVLPAVAVGDRALVIDFAPKGGPRDFTAVLDGKTGIKFLRDGNRWPRIDK